MPRKDRPLRSSAKNPFQNESDDATAATCENPGGMPAAAPCRPTIERPQYAGDTGPMTRIACTLALLVLLSPGAPAPTAA